jgi:hypothetical protein
MYAHVRHLPNFFILGARRAGTGSLTHYLGQHPDIQFTEPRDPAYFQKDEVHQLGVEYYIRTFCNNGHAKAWLGESSSCYFGAPHLVGPRMRAHYGDMPLKFIVLLREPVSRAWSHYLMRVHHGDEKRDFATALAEESKEPPNSNARYFDEGRYVHHLTEWQNYYPLDSFLLLLSEDLAANPMAQVRRVFTWLGVDPQVPINTSERRHVARYSRSRKLINFLNHPPAWIRSISKQIWPQTWQRHRIRHNLRERFQAVYQTPPPIDPAIAVVLRQQYRGEVLALSKLLGRYLSNWLSEDELEEPLTLIN